MKLFGREFTVKKIAETKSKSLGFGGWFPAIHEPFSGAWQSDTVAGKKEMLAHSAVFACVSLIASDIGKMPIQITARSGGVWSSIESDFDALIRRPNAYQNRIQFVTQWITSKLLHGNAYVLKRYGATGRVKELHVLDPRLVQVKEAAGNVYYDVKANDRLAGISEQGETFAARDIIHDRMNTFDHPLVGISPLSACAMATGQGIQILKNSSTYLKNRNVPGFVISPPEGVKKEDALRLKQEFDAKTSGDNAGKSFAVSAPVKIQSFELPAADSQIIEQLKWTAEDICRAFHVPAYMIGAGERPTYNNAEVLNQIYYSDCLQSLIEAMELCLDEGLNLPTTQRTEFDIDELLRMDSVSRFDALSKAIGAGWMAPNEARRREGMPPVEGGDSPLIQQQNYSLAALARRDAAGVPE